MLTLTEERALLNSRHTQNFTSYRFTKSHYRVEKHTKIPDIIYTQIQHLTGGKVRDGGGKCFTQTGRGRCPAEEMSARGNVHAGRCPVGVCPSTRCHVVNYCTSAWSVARNLFN